MNLIVLEGPDGAGKTTLARELEKCGCAYAHYGVPEPGVEAFRWFLNGLIQTGEFQSVAFDRLHLSDRIYHPVMRGGLSQMTELHERLIERYLYARGGQVVICLPPWRTVLSNWLKNQANEYVDSPKKLRQIYGGYYRLLRSERSYMHFDYTRSNVAAYAKGLMEMANYELPETWVGSPSARFLFVGERANGSPDLPFMSVHNSSGFLNSCLEDAGYSEEEIAFTNAYQADGNLNPHLIDIPPQGRLLTHTYIALGNVAHGALLNVPHDLVAHPLFWKRFHTSERNKYVNDLAKIRRRTP